MRRFPSIFGLLFTVGMLCCVHASAAEAESLKPRELEELHRLIKPARGESRWMEVEWYPSVWEARRRAAAEGKPIFLMAGSGGAPVAGC